MNILRHLHLSVLLTLSAAAQITVVTTQPDLSDIARRIGGEAVTVKSLTRGNEDLHLIRIRPSMLLRLRKADVFIQLGLSAEHSWVPALLRKARNRSVRPGSPGFVNASQSIKPLGIPTDKTRRSGVDVHPEGNPHYNLDPERIRTVARNIKRGFERVDPARTKYFANKLKLFEEDLNKHLKKWNKQLAPFRGAAFIEYHDTWVYFANRFHLKIVGRLEPKPGLAPTPSHLAAVIREARSARVGIIVARPAQRGTAAKVARETNAHTALLSLSSTEKDKGYFGFMDRVVKTFADHLKKPTPDKNRETGS